MKQVGGEILDDTAPKFVLNMGVEPLIDVENNIGSVAKARQNRSHRGLRKEHVSRWINQELGRSLFFFGRSMGLQAQKSKKPQMRREKSDAFIVLRAGESPVQGEGKHKENGSLRILFKKTHRSR
jgi:hypothetical protein